MSLGEKYLSRKKSTGIKTEISLVNVADGLAPMLHTLSVIGYKDKIEKIEFHWHDIHDDICPITIYVTKEVQSRTRKD